MALPHFDVERLRKTVFDALEDRTVVKKTGHDLAYWLDDIANRYRRVAHDFKPVDALPRYPSPPPRTQTREQRQKRAAVKLHFSLTHLPEHLLLDVIRPGHGAVVDSVMHDLIEITEPVELAEVSSFFAHPRYVVEAVKRVVIDSKAIIEFIEEGTHLYDEVSEIRDIASRTLEKVEGLSNGFKGDKPKRLMREALAVECRLLYRMLKGADSAYSSSTPEGFEFSGPVPVLIRRVSDHVDRGHSSFSEASLRNYIRAAGKALGEYEHEPVAPEDWFSTYRQRRAEANYRLG